MITTYVHQLPEALKGWIYVELQQAFSQEDCNDVESLIEDGMNSRLCDLEDTIDISKYIGGVSDDK